MRQIRTYRLICEGNCSDADALARADQLADEAAAAYRNPRIGQTAEAGHEAVALWTLRTG